MIKEKKIEILLYILVVGFTLAVIYHYFLGVYLQLPYPMNTFLFDPRDRFNDFVHLYEICANPYAQISAQYNHFPFLYLSANPLLIFPMSIAFLVYLAAFIIFLVNWLEKFFTTDNPIITKLIIFAISAMSYPVLMVYDRGNFEGVMFIFLAMFLHFYLKESYMKSALFLGLAIAIKPFPVLFVPLFIANKKYKESVVTIVVAGLLTIASYFLLQGDFLTNINHHWASLKMYFDSYVIQNLGLFFASSIFGAVKFLSNAYNNPAHVAVLASYYSIFAAVSSLLLMGYTLFCENVLWKKLTIITFMMLMFPYVSGDYRLVQLLIPLAAFIATTEKSKFDKLYIILYALLFVPKAYTYFLSIIVNPLLMVIFTIAIIIEHFLPKANTNLEEISSQGTENQIQG